MPAYKHRSLVVALRAHRLIEGRAAAAVVGVVGVAHDAFGTCPSARVGVAGETSRPIKGCAHFPSTVIEPWRTQDECEA